MIRIHLVALPLHYRRLIDLWYYHDYTYQEIAEELHLPLGTVKSHLHQSRRILHRKLAADNFFHPAG